MNLMPYTIWLFINLGCVFWGVLLMSVFKEKEYWDIRAWGSFDEQFDKFVWTRLFGSTAKLKNSPLFWFFFLLFSAIKRKSSSRRRRAVHISMRRTSTVLIFWDFLITYKKKKMECSSEFFNFISIDSG